MLTINKDNFVLYCAHYYDNPYCISEDEFYTDVFKASSIRKRITEYTQKGKTNVMLLINTVISFYNVFNHEAASKILMFKLDEEQIEFANSVLSVLNLPLMSDNINEEFAKEIEKEINKKQF